MDLKGNKGSKYVLPPPLPKCQMLGRRVHIRIRRVNVYPVYVVHSAFPGALFLKGLFYFVEVRLYLEQYGLKKGAPFHVESGLNAGCNYPHVSTGLPPLRRPFFPQKGGCVSPKVIGQQKEVSVSPLFTSRPIRPLHTARFRTDFVPYPATLSYA